MSILSILRRLLTRLTMAIHRLAIGPYKAGHVHRKGQVLVTVHPTRHTPTLAHKLLRRLAPTLTKVVALIQQLMAPVATVRDG